MRKVRSDAVLDNLPAEQQEQLESWLMDEHLNIKEVQQRLFKEFKVSVGRDPIRRYYLRLSGMEALEQLKESAALAKELPTGWRDEAEELRASVQYLMLQRIQQALLSGKLDADQLCRLGKLLLKLEEQAQREKAEQRKADEAQRNNKRWDENFREAVKIVRDVKRVTQPPVLSPEQKRAKARELLIEVLARCERGCEILQTSWPNPPNEVDRGIRQDWADRLRPTIDEEIREYETMLAEGHRSAEENDLMRKIVATFKRQLEILVGREAMEVKAA